MMIIIFTIKWMILGIAVVSASVWLADVLNGKERDTWWWVVPVLAWPLIALVTAVFLSLIGISAVHELARRAWDGKRGRAEEEP